MSAYLSICRVLIAAGVPKGGNNGSDVAPAVVVAVMPGDYVNARLFLDGPDVAWWTSRKVYDDKAAYDTAASEYVQQYPDAGPLQALYWPTRTA